MAARAVLAAILRDAALARGSQDDGRDRGDRRPAASSGWFLSILALATHFA